jgi:hypothetical protein
MPRETGRFLEPKPPSGQNARLQAGIEKETEGVTLVSTRHSAPQFPLHPYNCRQFVYAPKGSPGLPACPTPSRRPTARGR